MQNCLNRAPTLCLVKTMNGRVFGMYTDIPWSRDKQYHTNKFKSFIFRFNLDNTIKCYMHNGKTQKEVEHSKESIFNMVSPYASYGRKGYAYLNEIWVADKKVDR